MNEKKKVYIAGKITGDDSYLVKFARARSALERMGFIVLNPAGLPQGLSNADYARICMAMIDSADAVAVLPDWKTSAGATMEVRYCIYAGKKMFMPWKELEN